MTYDFSQNFLQIGTVIFAVLLIWVQFRSGKEKDRAAKAQEQTIASINLKVEQESIKRIEAETKLIDLQKRIAWRYFDQDKFVSVLMARPKGNAEIVFVNDDNESYMLAQSIWMALSAGGWNVDAPVISKSSDPNGQMIPFDLREGGIIMSNEARILVAVPDATEPKPYNQNNSLAALLYALQDCGLQFIQTAPHEGIRPPKGIIRIVVGSRL